MRLRRHELLSALFCGMIFLLAAAAQQNLSPDKGTIERGAYKNPSLGLAFTPDSNLKLESPELKGTPGSVPLLVTVAAWASPTWFEARQGTVFYADALAYYPADQRTPERYMGKVIRGNRAEGAEQVQGKTNDHLSGLAFLRADFRRGRAYVVVLVSTHNGYAIVFIFAGPDEKTVNKLVASTKLEFTH
jgi:hypothetical protein